MSISKLNDSGRMSEPDETVHQSTGYAFLPYSLIEVHGTDAQGFLHAQTTSDVKALQAYQSQMSALLDRKAKVVAYFTLYRKNKSYRLIADKDQTKTILEHLDKYVFSDKVEFLDLSTKSMLTLIGSNAREVLRENLKDKNLAVFEKDVFDAELAGIHVHVFKANICSAEAYFVYCCPEHQETLIQKLKPSFERNMLRLLSEEEIIVGRIEAGIPQFGKDFDGDNLIIELGMEDKAISYTKGCFQGQEVLARVKSHGSPNKQLAGLIFDDPPPSENIKIGTPLMVAGQEGAKVTSNAYSQKLNKHIGLCLLKREYRTPGNVFAASAGKWSGKATVQLLPFVEKEQEGIEARQVYQQGLKLYTDGKSDLAILKLRRALLLDPRLEDAYETLGVILSKEGQIDEAVRLMEMLAHINPDSIMAYANLSVFYLEQGGSKEKAEEAKAQSMSIRMRLAAKEAMQEHQQKEDSVKIQAEALERKAMFEQVIAIDPDDLFANNGLGNCYNILKEYAQAEKYLLKALSIKPTHTVAYQELGTTYEGLGELDKARAAYKSGIDLAAQKGEMTPLKQMQGRLDALNTKNS